MEVRSQRFPHNIEAEKALLAACMRENGSDIVSKCIKAKIESSSFFRPAHQNLFDAFVTLGNEGTEIDEITVEEKLHSVGLLDETGGRSYINEISESVGSTAFYQNWIEIVLDKAQRRKVLRAANYTIEKAYDGNLDEVHRLIESILTEASGKKTDVFADWEPIFSAGMEPPVPTIGKIQNGGHLLYPGRINEVHGEPSVGKTNLALSIVIDVIRNGGKVLFIDPEDTPQGLGSRLDTFGLPRDLIQSSFIYSSFESGFWPDYYRRVEVGDIELVVFDGIAEGMAAHGLSEKEESECLEFFRKFRPFKKAETTVLLTDHVAKDKDSRGLWGRGSGAKQGHYDGVSYVAELGKGYRPGIAGFVRMKIAKDRPGGVGTKGQTVAEIHFEPHDFVNTRTEIRIMGVQSEVDSETKEFRPTHIMEKIKQHLMDYPGSGKRDLRNLGKTKWIETGIKMLIAEGQIRTENGRRGAILHYLNEPKSEEKQEEFYHEKSGSEHL